MRIGRVVAVLLLAGGGAWLLRRAVARPEPPLTRHFLSGANNDWEPSLAVGGDGSVHVIAGRKLPVKADSAGPGDTVIVTWSSTDRGETMLPATTFPQSGGDARIKSDQKGNLYGSWIWLARDSAGRFDLQRGGLVLAKSRNLSRTWDTTIAATMPSGVDDKPELAVSPDGKDIYIAFMGRGTLDVVASHDGGVNWERHIADPMRTGHWPTSIALAPNGDLYLTNAKQLGRQGDSILEVESQLFRSTDQGKTWRQRSLGRSKRLADIRACVHGPTCPCKYRIPGSLSMRETGSISF